MIKKSLSYIKNYLEDSNSTLKAVLVSTRIDNAAKRLYKKALHAEAVAVINDLYSQDEVLMLARIRKKWCLVCMTSEYSIHRQIMIQTNRHAP